MRIGKNPLREKRAEGIAPYVVSVVTHLPNVTDEYHKQRMEVVQTCLLTARAGARLDHTFAVWDNGSMPELREWIEHEFKPDLFIQSPNIGLTSARAALSRMFPADTILAISDDDMLFFDNWLAPQVELLEHFPNVAAVTGYPVRTSQRWGNVNTLDWARRYAKLETGRFLPVEWEEDFAVSIGRDIYAHKENTAFDIDYRVTLNGKQAYCTAHHCQFIGYAGRIARAAEFDNRAMNEERTFDCKLDEIGLRLATTQRHARHIGNVLDDKLRSEIWQQQALQH